MPHLVTSFSSMPTVGILPAPGSVISTVEGALYGQRHEFHAIEAVARWPTSPSLWTIESSLAPQASRSDTATSQRLSSTAKTAQPAPASCLPEGIHGPDSSHSQEALLVELRSVKRTLDGRTPLRERVAEKHTPARTCRRRGPRARAKGVRKSFFDPRRVASTENLHVLLRKAA